MRYLLISLLLMTSIGCLPNFDGLSDGQPDAGASDSGPPAAGTIVPLYTEPSDSSWMQMLDAKKKHPAVPVVAIINPNSGPGLSKDPVYQSGITRLIQGGCTVLGYVPTGYGRNSSDDVKAKMALYHSWYQDLNGIMFDEMSSDSNTKDYYRSLADYARSLGFTMTVGNPGTEAPADLIGVFDVLLVYDKAGLPDLSSLFHLQPYRDHLGIVSYEISSLDKDFVSNAKSDVRYLYLTNDGDPNSWDSLSSYFESLLAALE